MHSNSYTSLPEFDLLSARMNDYHIDFSECETVTVVSQAEIMFLILCAIRVLVDLPLSTSCWLIILLLREIGFDFVLIWMFWACVKRAVESGGSTRNSREDLYGSRNYRGSNSSLNDGRFPFFFLLNHRVVFVSTSYSACCLFFVFFLSPTNFSTFFMFEFIFVSLH